MARLKTSILRLENQKDKPIIFDTSDISTSDTKLKSTNGEHITKATKKARTETERLQEALGQFEPKDGHRRLIKKKNFSNFVFHDNGDMTIAEVPEFVMTAQELSSINEPRTYNEAKRDSNWQIAIQKEYKALTDNGTWELCQLPKGRKAITCKWVFKLKLDSDGKVASHKARLVARGFTQQEGIDFKETYSPVVKFTTIRLLLAFATEWDMNVHQLDISTAYLNADIEEELYMMQPEGFVQYDSSGKPLVCRMKKSLYGLRQAERNWNHTIDKWLIEQGFTKSQADPCLYIKITQNREEYLIVALYVDDILTVSHKTEIRNNFVDKLSKRFKLTDGGEAKWFLGMRITRNQIGYRIDQRNYFENILKRFDMENCRMHTKPAVTDDKNLDRESEADFNQTKYLELVGSLIYASVISRPDIAFAVGKAGRYMSNPKEIDWNNGLRILKYLRYTLDLGIQFHKTGHPVLTGYSDSDWAGDIYDRKSTSGHIFTLGGAAISWTSKKQNVVAISSTEAEFIAGSTAVQEAIYLRTILADLGAEQYQPTILYQDNLSAIRLEKDANFGQRSKHIDVKYRHIQHEIRRNTIQIKYLPTDMMIADILTKPVSADIISRFRFSIHGEAIDHSEVIDQLREGVGESMGISNNTTKVQNSVTPKETPK